MYDVQNAVFATITASLGEGSNIAKLTTKKGRLLASFQTVDKTPACFPRWGFVLRIKNNKKRLIYAVFWRFCGIMIVTNLK